MSYFKATTKLDKFFEIGILIKAFDGTVETIGGIVLLFISPSIITHSIFALVHSKLIGEPDDFIANYLLHTSSRLTSATTIFAALYLLSHGVTKIILVYEILRNRLWAYKALIVLTGGFMVYQSYEWYFKHSVGLLILTIFDAVIIYLTIREYRSKTDKIANA
ncbi:MAG: DUF2127 domain-containing protein [Candidatus Saccharimonadales bacterium]